MSIKMVSRWWSACSNCTGRVRASRTTEPLKTNDSARCSDFRTNQRKWIHADVLDWHLRSPIFATVRETAPRGTVLLDFDHVYQTNLPGWTTVTARKLFGDIP